MTTYSTNVRRYSMGVLGILLNFPAQAQILPDTTLGPEQSFISPNISIQGDSATLIQGGAERGSNVFHSFSEFNVGATERVYYANPVGIDSIISRVTGQSISHILGTLGVAGDADLFLLNPTGIIFGPEATLDISGSFYATTAEAIEIGNGVFSAVAPRQNQLLTVRPSVTFANYLTNNSGDITNRGQLAVGGDLILAGHNLDLAAQVAAIGNVSLLATDTVTIRDTALEPFIGLAGEDLLIEGKNHIDIFALNHTDSELFAYGDLTLRSAAQVHGDARYFSGGDFRIEDLDSQLSDLASPEDPVIRALGNVSFDNYFGTSLHIIAGGSVTVPGIILVTGAAPSILNGDSEETNFIQEDVVLSDNTTVVDIHGGQRPTLDIRAGVAPSAVALNSDSSSPDGTSALFFEVGQLFGFPVPITTDAVLTAPTADLRADITLGSILFADFNSIFELAFIRDTQDIVNRLIPGDILLTNQYEPNTALEGDITLASTLADSLNEFNILPMTTLPAITIQAGGIDAPGRLHIDGRNNLNISGLINTSELPQNIAFNADGGDIIALAEGDIHLQPGAVIVSAGLSSGEIRFENPNGTLKVDDSAVISLSVGGTTPDTMVINAANVEISRQTGAGIETVRNLLEFVDNNSLDFLLEDYNSSGLLTTSDTLGTASALEITTGELEILNNGDPNLPGDVGIATFTPGGGGNLTITADVLTIVGNDPAEVDFLFPTRDLALEISSIPTGITTAALGNAQGGDLTLNVRQLSISKRAAVTSGAIGPGPGAGMGGTLRINGADVIDLQGPAVIATGTLGPGDSGDIIIENAGTVTLSNGAIIAADSVGSSDAGSLTIDGEQLLVSGGSRISSATGDQGRGGEIALDLANSITLTGTSPEFNNGQTIASGVFTDAQGSSPAGSITVMTPQLTLTDGATISATTQGPAIGGDITVIGESVDLVRSQITASSNSSGNAGRIQLILNEAFNASDSDISTAADQSTGGAIEITADRIFLAGDSDIRTNVLQGQGGGGNITLAAQSILAFDDSDILTFAIDGRGGDITLNTPIFFGENYTPGAPPPFDQNNRVDINATGQLSSGSIVLPDVNFIENNLTTLPENFINLETLLANSCITDSQTINTSLIITPSDSLPQQPGNPASSYSLSTAQTIPNQEARRLTIEEPQTIYPLENGRLVMGRTCDSTITHTSNTENQ